MKPQAVSGLVKLSKMQEYGKIPSLDRIVVAVDPSATSTGDDAGIIVAGRYGDEGYVLADKTIQGSPLTWAQGAVGAYHHMKPIE